MLSNNDILKKIRVALQLTDEDILKILKLSEFEMTKSELGALFRKPDHINYRECGDQILRNFLNGLITHKRGPKPGGIEKNGPIAKKITQAKASANAGDNNDRQINPRRIAPDEGNKKVIKRPNK